MIDPKLFLNDISPIDHGDDSRYFYKDKGVPSVTELLSFIDNQKVKIIKILLNVQLNMELIHMLL